ncbi:MAG TPA: type II secretion system protein [Gemmatales bacterium]|nr:type II secretion system protein [Gemmatales bacterium]HMP16287.1 type II secretion system protein [Gemmatales bacterium]
MRCVTLPSVTVQNRRAFTLVELLVVISIVVILMALTVGVISKVYVYLDEVKVTNEVNRMAQACEQFKATFGRYPPSRIILCDNPVILNNIINGLVPPPAGSGLSLPQFQQLAAFSSEYLSSIFPGINLTLPRDWNGNSTVDNLMLDGAECLVYFLAGPRFGGAPIGFNTDKTNPTANSTSTRLGPFFDFDASRIDTTIKPGYPTYRDVYGTPYLYFAARNGATNNYHNAYFPLINTTGNDNRVILTALLSPGTTYSFVPYFVSPVPAVAPTSWPAAQSFKFHKADTFQIISAGKDRQFGTGGQWNQADPEQSLFLPAALINAAPYNSLPEYQPVTPELLQANYDNITNVTGGRVVPK